MKNFKQKKVHYVGRGIILPAIVLVLMLLVLFLGVRKFMAVNEEQNRVLTEQSIKKAAIQCYSNEGMYPADIEYLTENYYVNIDYNRYSVVYICYASNIMPTIEVYRKYSRETAE